MSAQDAETTATIALMQSRGGAWARLGDEILAMGSAVSVLKGDMGGQQSLLPDGPSDEDETEAARASVAEWALENIEVVPLADPRYPLTLRGVSGRPPALFVRGQITPEDDRAVAIVGSRDADPEAQAWATEVAEGLASRGVTIVSGLAMGIDRAAHEGALRGGGRTLAVLGSGLQQLYPAAHRDLAAAITRQGAVLSQFWPSQRPSRQTFPMRNAVISGLCRAVIVVDGREGSGTQIQAELAIRQGRWLVVRSPLMAEPWVGRKAGSGLIIPATDPSDAINELQAILG
jgi:DNA processing protein